MNSKIQYPVSQQPVAIDRGVNQIHSNDVKGHSPHLQYLRPNINLSSQTRIRVCIVYLEMMSVPHCVPDIQKLVQFSGSYSRWSMASPVRFNCSKPPNKSRLYPSKMSNEMK